MSKGIFKPGKLIDADTFVYYDLETTLDWKTIHMVVWQLAARTEAGDYAPAGEIHWAQPGTPGWQAFKLALSQYKAHAAHNNLGFDRIRLAEHYGDRLWDLGHEVIDSLPLARMLMPDNPGGHSAEALFPVVGEVKLKAPDFEVFTAEMVTYALQDVKGGNKLACHCLNEMERMGFSRDSIKREYDCVPVVRQVTENGFELHMQRAQMLLASIADTQNRVKAELGDLFYPELVPFNGAMKVLRADREVVTEAGLVALKRQYPGMPDPEPSKRGLWYRTSVNLNSRPQLVARLLSMGWKPFKFTDGSIKAWKLWKGAGGKASGQPEPAKVPTLDDDTLEVLEQSGIRCGKPLSDWFKALKYKGFVESWIQFCGPDGRVHGSIIPHGAPTARMAHFKPNMAQVPKVSKENAWGQACRECFVAGLGKIIVGFDAAGIEFRGLLHYAQDDEMTDVGLNGDIHSVHRDLFSDQLGSGKEGRDRAKTLIYAFMFGAQAGRIGAILGGGRDLGEYAMVTLLDKWPGLATLTKKVQRLAEKYGWLPGLDGRFLQVRSQHAALNTLLQSFGAIVMKQALLNFVAAMEAAGIEFKIVALVHDEIQVEVTIGYEERVKVLGVAAIVQAGVDLGVRVPLAGEAKAGPDWASTH